MPAGAVPLSITGATRLPRTASLANVSVWSSTTDTEPTAAMPTIVGADLMPAIHIGSSVQSQTGHGGLGVGAGNGGEGSNGNGDGGIGGEGSAGNS